jgi:hypothetical protein
MDDSSRQRAIAERLEQGAVGAREAAGLTREIIEGLSRAERQSPSPAELRAAHKTRWVDLARHPNRDIAVHAERAARAVRG